VRFQFNREDRRDFLSILEIRLPLFDEGFHALLLIVGRKQRVEHTPLEADAFRKRAFE
jgi:hypothetical protein